MQRKASGQSSRGSHSPGTRPALPRITAAIVFALAPSGCLVDEKCYADADCIRPRICSVTGECEFQCSVDADCDNAAGAERICDNNRCVVAVQCTVCAFAHADASCLHGVCRMGSCAAGYHNINGDSIDGCEYTCSPSGPERCDQRDNDCNGLIDDGLDAQTDCAYECIPTGEEQCDSLDNDCDGEVDEGVVCVPSCPPDMVAIGAAYCVDEYEASRSDSTDADPGQNGTIALSRPAVMPWMVNPMSSAHLAEFQAACVAAGKHLCSREEWFAACSGPEQTPFVYGNTFDREACNCVDTFCDDYCVEQGMSSTQCSVQSNCGYTYDCYHAVPTGQFPTCTNSYGTLDMNGNAWEVVTSSADARGYEIRGGAFNCASASQRVNCSFNAGWLELFAGFRCCKAIVE